MHPMKNEKGNKFRVVEDSVLGFSICWVEKPIKQGVYILY